MNGIAQAGIVVAFSLVAHLAAAGQHPDATAPRETVAGIQESIRRADFAAARAQLESALRRYPADGGLYNLQGIVAARSNDYAGAEAAFRKAVRLSPALTGAWLNLGRLYQTNVDRDPQALEKGVEVYRRILAVDPVLAEAHHQLALLLLWRGDFHESLAHLDQLPPEEHGRTGALAIRCAVQAGAGDLAAAQATARRLLARPDLVEGDVLAILPALQKTNRDDVARVLLEGLADRNLSSKESLAPLATLYERAGELARARTAYEAVARDSAAMVKPLLDLARVAWKQKDYEGTLGYLAHARALEPGNAAIHFFFGLTANEMHLPVEAKKSLQKALELAPDNPYYNYAMGAVQMGWADKQKALPYLRKYTAARPKDPRGHLALAVAYFLMNQFEEAKAEATPMAGDPAVKPAAEYLLGKIACENNDLDEAAERLRTALRLAPEMSDAHADLGLVLFEKEDYAGAERETKLALARDPDSYVANRTLMQLYQRAKDPRAPLQANRLKTLVDDRNRKAQLMLRTIEVRPY